MLQAERLAALIASSVCVILVTVFVAHLLGAIATFPATVQQSQCEITVDVVCPATDR